MTGRRFARVLKNDTEARHDFDDLLLEQRTEIHKQLESASGRKNIYILQGKIRFLDDFKNVLDGLYQPEESDTPS